MAGQDLAKPFHAKNHILLIRATTLDGSDNLKDANDHVVVMILE